MNAKRPSTNILQKVKEHVRNGAYILREHAIQRQRERCISLPDVLRVLAHGRHENSKDVFDVKNQRWKHAIRGKTIYRNNMKNRFLAASALPWNSDAHSRLAYRQWSLAPHQNSREPPCQKLILHVVSV